MAKSYKHIRAGRYVCAVAYSRIKAKDGPQARAEKHRHSSKAQQLVNDRSSRLQLTAIIAENFADDPGSFFCSPDFDDEHYPMLSKQSEYWDFCIAEGKKYIARLNSIAKRRGNKIVYVYWPGLGENNRWHLHMLIKGVTAEDLRDAWSRGNADYHNLYSDRKWLSDRDWWSSSGNVNPVAIAKYAMHNAKCRLLGKHPWHASRNCIRPKCEPVRILPDAECIDPPEGAEILSQEKTSTLFSSFEFYEYILPPQAKPARKRRRRSSASRQ